MTSPSTPSAKVMKENPVVLALDPGTTQSAVLLWEHDRIAYKGIHDNQHLLDRVLSELAGSGAVLAIEQVRSYGMAVGAETFDTVHWSGRFHQKWEQLGGKVVLVPRLSVKMHLCHTARAKDANVWCALTDRFGLPGKKANPGFLFGVVSHERAALALAIYCADTGIGNDNPPSGTE